MRDDAGLAAPDAGSRRQPVSSMISMPDTVALLITGSNVRLIFP
jgi:hypothetical protein